MYPTSGAVMLWCSVLGRMRQRHVRCLVTWMSSEFICKKSHASNDGQKLFPSKLGEVSIAEEFLLKLLLFFMCWISLNARSISVDGMILSTHHPIKTVLHLLGYFKTTGQFMSSTYHITRQPKEVFTRNFPPDITTFLMLPF